MSLTKVSYSMITGAPVNIRDYGAVGDGVTNDTTAIQAALTYADSIRGYVVIPTGTFVVNATLTPGDANIVGEGGILKYTGSAHCLIAPSVIQGVIFQGPGRATSSIGIKSAGGFKNQVVQCTFTLFGTGIEFSGSGQKIQRSYFTTCGTGVKVVKYPSPSTDPTTTFTSEKNWYEVCTNGLWIDSTGASSGMISCSSIDDIWQLCEGSGLRLQSATFPMSLINPHTEQNSATAGWFAFNFVNSNVVQIGGYKAASINTDSIDGNTFYQVLSYNGTQVKNVYALSDLAISKVAYSYDANIGLLSISASTNVATQQVEFAGGAYNNTFSARYKMFGGFGDNAFIYGNFVESERTVGIGDGVNFHLGVVTKGSPDIFTRKVTMDYLGNLYPYVDDTRSIGTASNLWSEVYAANGTINTSDRNRKQQIEELSEAEKQVAQAIKQLIRKFKFKNAVAKKGESARIHVGVIAQDVEKAFQDAGLDASRYGLFCSDTWHEYNEQPVEVNSNGKFVESFYAVNGERVSVENKEDLPANAVLTNIEHDTIEKTRLGIRYDELLAFIISSI
jgi:ribosomal protein L9